MLVGEVAVLRPRVAALRRRIATAAAVEKNRKQRAGKRRATAASVAGDGDGVGDAGVSVAQGGGECAPGCAPGGYQLEVLGHIRSCFKQKFGIPRQPGLAPLATAELVLHKPWSTPDAVRGLEGWSHLWVTFIFHAVQLGKQFKATVSGAQTEGGRGGHHTLFCWHYCLPALHCTALPAPFPATHDTMAPHY